MISRMPRKPGPDPVYAATPEEIKALQVIVAKARLGDHEYRWQQGYPALARVPQARGSRRRASGLSWPTTVTRWEQWAGAGMARSQEDTPASR